MINGHIRFWKKNTEKKIIRPTSKLEKQQMFAKIKLHETKLRIFLLNRIIFSRFLDTTNTWSSHLFIDDWTLFKWKFNLSKFRHLYIHTVHYARTWMKRKSRSRRCVFSMYQMADEKRKRVFKSNLKKRNHS